MDRDIKWMKLSDLMSTDWKDLANIERIKSNNDSFNTFFWWEWIAKWSINLIAWLPWVWKSTFLLYISKYFPKLKIVYISWEETEYQILWRAKRMKIDKNDFDNVSVFYQNDLSIIEWIIENEKPNIVIIDSLNMLETEETTGETGGMKQQKYITRKLVTNIKSKNIITFLVWHVNQEWEIWWAQFISHMVDAVIKIEPATERWDSLKIMKNLKNRFSWESILVYELYTDNIVIVDQSKLMDLFIAETAIWTKGTALSAITMDWGHQVFLCEVQWLVTPMEFNFPERIISNFSKDRLKILLKIIGENINSNIYKSDVAINIVSPLRYNGNEIELAIIIAIISCLYNYDLGRKVFIGTVWFNWEIKSISRQRDMIHKLKGYWINEEDIISSDKYKNIKDIINFLAKELKMKNNK
jgi:DNA repair protein RadA/Sms